MDVRLSLPFPIKQTTIAITGSKSETNRLLLLQTLYPGLRIENESESDDSRVMRKALSSATNVIDIHHAGTAMRFLTAFFALQEGREVTLTGSERMQERPIKELVDALQVLGAQIKYKEKAGYPPLIITGKRLPGGKVTIKANMSSQYITALLLIGAKMEKGLELKLEGEITSLPYILMTTALLRSVGVEAVLDNDTISVKPVRDVEAQTITVESDWSSASYYYSIMALSPLGMQLSLTSYRKESIQGDSVLPDIYSAFGVTTEYNDGIIVLRKERASAASLKIELNLNQNPDLAQTIAVTCFGLGIACELSGLHTLKIKETDRLVALKTELNKFGAIVNITDDSLTLEPSGAIKSDVTLHTYNDHRMAMAFAPLAAVGVSFAVEEAGVVSKSYPKFWDDLQTLGFIITKSTT